MVLYLPLIEESSRPPTLKKADNGTSIWLIWKSMKTALDPSGTRWTVGSAFTRLRFKRSSFICVLRSIGAQSRYDHIMTNAHLASLSAAVSRHTRRRNLNDVHEPDNHFFNMLTMVRNLSCPREGGKASGRSAVDSIVGPSIEEFCSESCMWVPRGHSAMRHLAGTYKLPLLTTYVISPFS